MFDAFHLSFRIVLIPKSFKFLATCIVYGSILVNFNIISIFISTPHKYGRGGGLYELSGCMEGLLISCDVIGRLYISRHIYN